MIRPVSHTVRISQSFLELLLLMSVTHAWPFMCEFSSLLNVGGHNWIGMLADVPWHILGSPHRAQERWVTLNSSFESTFITECLATLPKPPRDFWWLWTRTHWKDMGRIQVATRVTSWCLDSIQWALSHPLIVLQLRRDKGEKQREGVHKTQHKGCNLFGARHCCHHWVVMRVLGACCLLLSPPPPFFLVMATHKMLSVLVLW